MFDRILLLRDEIGVSYVLYPEGRCQLAVYLTVVSMAHILRHAVIFIQMIKLSALSGASYSENSVQLYADWGGIKPIKLTTTIYWAALTESSIA